jgi:hypothetical protein
MNLKSYFLLFLTGFITMAQAQTADTAPDALIKNVTN